MELKAGYKRTEIGVIPENWEVKRLGNVCGNITTGKLDANAMAENGEYPFFTCARSHYWIDKYAFDAEALLVSGNGANVGYIHYYNGKFNAYQRTYVLTDFNEEIGFIKLFMDRSLQQRIRTEVNAGNTPYIKKSTLAEMSVAIPPLPEQQAIAAVLSDVDALISALDKLIAKKRDIKQAAMQQLLTGKKRLPGFSGEWEVKKLGGIGLFKKGRNIPKNQLSTQGEPCVLYGEIYTRYDCVVKELVSFIPKDVADQSTVIKPGDILFAGSGETAEEIGKCFAYVGAKNAYAGGDLIILSPKEDDSVFLGYQLNSPMICIQKANLGQGSSVVHIYVSGLATVKVPLPPLPEQQAIATILSDMDAEIAALEQRRDKTRALKQGTMQELLTGRIRLT